MRLPKVTTGEVMRFKNLSINDIEGLSRSQAQDLLRSMREAFNNAVEEGTLMHAFPGDGTIPTDGMVGPSETTASQTYGFRDPDMLFRIQITYSCLYAYPRNIYPLPGKVLKFLQKSPEIIIKCFRIPQHSRTLAL